MKVIYCLLIALIGSSCAMKNYSQMKKGTYYLVDLSDLGAFEDEQIEKAVNKSKVKLELNEETGSFSGIMNSNKFRGQLDLGKVSSGFVKGFYVNTELGYLQTGSSDDKLFGRFTSSLANASRLYFYNDKLIDPRWSVLEISIKEGDKLIFIMKK